LTEGNLMATAKAERSSQTPTELDLVVIRFAGDSGDGMQLTGSQFTTTSALAGNDLATLPDYPAEIRAPAGTIAGVSGFQLAFSSREIFTPGDDLDVLVAMNPAALKRNLADLKRGGVLIANTDAFTARNLKLVGYETNPLEGDSLSDYRLIPIDISTRTASALADSGLSTKEVERCKNFFTLGILYWMYSRSLDPTLEWFQEKFGKKPELAAANTTVLKAGHVYGENCEIFDGRYEVRPRSGMAPGTYTSMNGNRSTALGFVAAAKQANLPLFLGSYPITPATDILHELSYLRNHGVITFQAEDEIAGICSAIGASFGGHLAITSTSGPGLALKSEALGLAHIAELPLVVINVQRGGPSTGLPTKTEQADLMQCMYGRNGEAPVPLVAAQSPSDCFDAAIEASRIALEYMTPVILLTDGYLANGSEPWKIPEVSELPKINIKHHSDKASYQPYARDEKTLTRPWAVPGTPELEHRLGGLEKEHIYGGVSYNPENHEFMIKLRAEKIERIQNSIADAHISGEDKGKLLILGWGSTFGAIETAVMELRAQGKKVSHMHLRHLNPFPKNVGKTLKAFDKVLMPEINNGQLVRLLRAEYLADNLISLPKIKGLPFKTSEIVHAALELL